MVKAIDFAVRTSAGKVVRGAVSGDGGSEFLQVGSGETVSLNLSQSSVLGYERQGNDLVVKLSDGRQINLSGYFESNPGEDNRLYLSSNGDVTEVFLTDGGDGTMYASYGPVDTWNKYSNVDDIRFVEDNTLAAGEGYADDTVGMGPFTPGILAGLGGGGMGAAAAGLGGLALVGGGGGSGGNGGGSNGDPTRIPPAVDNATDSKDISTVTEDKAVVVTGTGEPGETVKVVIGDETQTTVIKEDGTWETTFEDENFPADGSYEAEVTVTDKDGGTEVLDGPAFVIDLTPPAVSTTEGTVSVGDVENLVEYGDGVTVAGEGEAGAKIVVTVEGHSHETTVSDDGKWSVTFTQTEIVGGEYTIPVTITATDAMGNQTVITDQIEIDTVPHPLSFNSVTSDNVVNHVEASGEVIVTGASTAGAMVTVVMEGNTQTVETNTNGTWTVRYPAGTFATGDGDRTFTATTVDAAGNSSTSTHTMKVDTTTTVTFSTGNLTSDNVINAVEANEGVTLTGQAEAGSTSVSVTWNNVTLPADVAEDGSWSVKFPTSAVQATGTTTATVTAVDAYGNTDTDTRDITVDRSTTVSVNPNQAGGDDIITGSEADAGINLTGLAEKGAKVEVTFQGVTRTVTASETDGSWTARFNSADIDRGTYANGDDNQVNVKATDKAGNVATTTHTLNVDTEVQPFTAATNAYNTDKADGVLNNAEALGGLTVTGTVEAGSTVMVQLGNAGPYEAVTNGTTWSYTFDASEIPTGDTTATLTATATDALGNVSAPYTEVIDIDRIVSPFNRSGGALGGDGTLNAVEVAAGLDLNGKAEAGSTVVVKLANGAEQSVLVGSNGNWSVRFEADQLPRGEGSSMKIDFEATDAAGNFASFSETVAIDTVAETAPSVTYILKSTSGATGLSGVFLDETVDSDFSFHRVDDNGVQSQMNLKASSFGSDFASFDGSTVPEGDYLVINHQDDAGNDSATLLVTNNTGTRTVDLGNTAFQNFDFTQLDLTLAPTNMTISAEDLIAITGPENTLKIKGGADDHIILENGAIAADQADAPAGFTLYTLGDGASVLLDDEIQPTF